VPPPLPRARFSPLLLISLLLLLFAVVARTLLNGPEEWIQDSLQAVTLVGGGLAAAAVALIASLIAAISPQRRGWPLAILICVGSLVIGWYLVGDLRSTFTNLLTDVQEAGESSSMEGVDAATQPVPQEKSALTAAQILPSMVAWGEEMMVRPYLEHGRRNPAWDDAALQLIRGSALDVGGSSKCPDREEQRATALQLRRAGCDDPWVQLLIHRLYPHNPDNREASERAAEAIAQGGYGPFPLWLARTEVIRATRLVSPKECEPLMPGCLEALQQALTLRPLTLDDYRIWCHLLYSEPGDSLLEQDSIAVCRVIESIDGIEEWFYRTIRGLAQIELAWLARGSGWSNTVSENQWKRFHEHLAIGRTELERACELAPAQPEPARSLMTVHLGSAGIDEMRAAFDHAISGHFDYFPAYRTLRQGLMPRWFGSEEALLAFGRACLATERFETGVPLQMLRAVQVVAEDRDDEHAYYRQDLPWEELETMFAGYLTKGDPARRSYYLSIKTVLADKNGRQELAADLLKQLDYQIHPQAATEWELPVEYAGYLAATTSSVGQSVLTASSLQEGLPEKALDHLLAARKGTDLPANVPAYLDHRIATVTALVALTGTMWQPLTPPADLAGWKVGAGEWRVVNPTTLEATADERGALLTLLPPVGQTWEVRGEIEFVHRDSRRSEAALFCGPTDELAQRAFSVRYWCAANRESGISVARGFGDFAESKDVRLKVTSPFFMRFANQRLRIRSGERQWFSDQPLPEGVTIDDSAQLSLGSTAAPGQKVRFRNLEYRTVTRGN